jgi:hypothetical protein
MLHCKMESGFFIGREVKRCPINGFQPTSRKIVLTSLRGAGELPNKELVTCCLAARRGTQST